MTSTRSAADSGLPKADDDSPNWPKTQERLFDQRYAEWLQVRAELAAFELSEIDETTADDVDKKHFELSCRLDDAERLVMTTHAVYADYLWKKMAVFELALHGSADSNEDRRDNKKVWMFGCIKADLMSLGVGDGNDSLSPRLRWQSCQRFPRP